MKWLVLMPNLRLARVNLTKLKFARDAYTIGRHPSIKDGLGFKREVKKLTSHKASISAKEKGKAPIASCVQKNHAFLYQGNILGMFIMIEVAMMLFHMLMIQMQCLLQVLL